MIERLQRELALIQSPEIRAFAEAALNAAPAYWWTIPSSSSGKYHPPDERGEGGMVLHTRRVARLCEEYARMADLDSEGRDLLIAAGLLHDLVVRGTRDEPMERTWPDHSIGIWAYLPVVVKDMLSLAHLNTILGAIDVHEGRWSPHGHPRPGTLGYLLHLADYTASRSFVFVEPL